MKTKIDLDSWPRRDYYRYFGSFDDPFFGVVVNVDCTRAYERCKKQDWSFFVYYLYASIRAINQVENFRLRIIDGEVWLFDKVHASSTVGRKDGTFGFALFDYTEDFMQFRATAEQRIAQVQEYPGLRVDPDAKRVDVVHYTALPWFSFSGFKHEKSIRCQESIPKIAFGKYFESNGRKLLPISINANHGLLDAYHIGKYLELFQEGLDA
ncbi:MAG: chloramphenicol acetyltransferase [Candidatus Bathyarchaeota archaeon]|nr:chloramphenicol acetyltransferase [Candidatus Bathyarchaeota archaeon]